MEQTKRDKYIEKYYPLTIGTIAAIAYLCLFEVAPKFAMSKGFRELITAAITINSISIGFLATAKATLISIHNSRIVRWLKECGTYETTINHFSEAVNWSMVCATFSAILLLIDFENPVKYIVAAIAIWVLLVVTSMLCMYRVINLFTKILLKA